jgi:hypothetical protein
MIRYYDEETTIINVGTVNKKLYVLGDAVKAIITKHDNDAKAKAKKGNAKEDAERKLKAEADYKEAQAEMAEIKLKEIRGQMHRSEDVEAAMNDIVYAFRSGVLAMPGRLAMDVAKVSDPNQVSKMIEAECFKVLDELSNYQYDPEYYKKRVTDREGMSIDEESEDGRNKEAQ